MSAGMTRVQAIWQHPLYQKHLNALTRLESDRIFCRHTPEHFLDVARLAYIFALERNHDIGRAEQYTNGTPHDEAGVTIAGQILADLNFSESEKAQILTAIGEHRSSTGNLPILSQIIYEADKKSRNCFLCSAEKECYWAPEKKNMTIRY